MAEIDPYNWGFRPATLSEQAAAPPDTVLRYKVTYNGKLLPVYNVIGLPGRNERWASDYYHVQVEDGGSVSVTEKASDEVVHVYNAGHWLELWYEYQSSQEMGWHKATNLQVMTREEANAGQS